MIQMQQLDSEVRGMLKGLRKEIKSYPSGTHFKIISERSKKSLSYVSMVLNGKVYNKEIVSAAIEYRDELRAKYRTEWQILKEKLAS